MTRLYCPECSEYLEGGDGECHDCSCGWKQAVDDQCFSGELDALKAENTAQAKRIADLTEDNLKQKDLILNFQTQYAKDHTEIESLRKQVEEHKEWHMIRDEMRKALEMQMNGGSK